MRFQHVLSIASAITLATVSGGSAPQDLTRWPQPTIESRPWSRWWWLGSAVDTQNLASLLTRYRDAGFGGMEICPIYGAKGAENRYIDFLSPRWMEVLAHTTREASRLGIGIDMTDGTGWPFGGPGVTPEDASSRLLLTRYEASSGKSLSIPGFDGSVRTVMAFSSDGSRLDLTDRLSGGKFEWTPPSGEWRVYAAAQQGPVQKVKRAAPGGAGNVLDPYSTTALDRYLGRFDRAFAGFAAPLPRAHFHDSFEYYNASWSPDLLVQFSCRRGYDLRSELPALFGDGSPETVARVKHDYRETLFEMHVDYIRRWTVWAHGHNGLTRNQAHGAPGNLLDLYAAVDIPETEIFGPLDDSRLPIQSLASSAAHAAGKRLASAESFTWLGEHFQVPLSQLKPAADYLFLAGINHLVYHGIPYSPHDAAWPGWLFYAAVNFGPNGGLWRDLPTFNGYVTRCQSALQGGRPDNDVLLYFPIHDLWQNPEGLLIQFPIEGKWMLGTAFHGAAQTLVDRGFAYDAVSDSLLANARVERGAIALGAGRYRVIVVPKCRLIPLATLRKLGELANAGAAVIFQGSIPADVPGFANLTERRADLNRLRISLLNRSPQDRPVFVGASLLRMLEQTRAVREPMADHGLRFTRRKRPDGSDYFIVNSGERAMNGWATLGAPAKSAVLMDPRFANKTGVAAIRQTTAGVAQVRLQLAPGESVFLRTATKGRPRGATWRYTSPSGDPVPLAGTWQVRFVDGGPVLPSAYSTQRLASWTTAPDPEAKRFAGTARYTVTFDHPSARAGDWLLDLGRVCESARVRLNGRDVAALWCPPYRISVGARLRPRKNTLEIEVTNLAANRIADMDRRGVPWKTFHDINFVGKDYKPFDASKWPLRDSGLVGPVTLVPVHVGGEISRR